MGFTTTGWGWNESCPAMGAAPHMQIVNATAIVVLVWLVGFMSVHEQSAQGIYATGSASATAGPSTPRESINTITLKAVVGWRWIEGLHSVACIHPVRWKALKLRLQSCCNCSTVNCLWDWNSQTEHSHLGFSLYSSMYQGYKVVPCMVFSDRWHPNFLFPWRGELNVKTCSTDRTDGCDRKGNADRLADMSELCCNHSP